jgi:hypothetical protein
MGGNLHRLCDVCSLIRLKLHDLDQCNDLGCDYREAAKLPSDESIEGFHSLPHRHQGSYESLEQSAHEGCHLCTIIRVGFQQASGFSAAGNEVLLFWSLTGNSDSHMGFLSEQLRAVCGSISVVFDLADIPTSTCAESRGKESSSNIGTSCSNILWTGSCIQHVKGLLRAGPQWEAPAEKASSPEWYAPGTVSISQV